MGPAGQFEDGRQEKPGSGDGQDAEGRYPWERQLEDSDSGRLASLGQGLPVLVYTRPKMMLEHAPEVSWTGVIPESPLQA